MKPLGVCCGRDFYDRDSWHEHQMNHRKEKRDAGSLLPNKKEKAMSNVKSNVKSTGDLLVVETEDDELLLGYVEEVDDETVILRTGFVGRPFVLQKQSITSVQSAKDHPYVEWL